MKLNYEVKYEIKLDELPSSNWQIFFLRTFNFLLPSALLFHYLRIKHAVVILSLTLRSLGSHLMSSHHYIITYLPFLNKLRP